LTTVASGSVNVASVGDPFGAQRVAREVARRNAQDPAIPRDRAIPPLAQ
jgi:hypothetical protein